MYKAITAYESLDFICNFLKTTLYTVILHLLHQIATAGIEHGLSKESLINGCGVR